MRPVVFEFEQILQPLLLGYVGVDLTVLDSKLLQNVMEQVAILAVLEKHHDLLVGVFEVLQLSLNDVEEIVVLQESRNEEVEVSEIHHHLHLLIQVDYLQRVLFHSEVCLQFRNRLLRLFKGRGSEDELGVFRKMFQGLFDEEQKSLLLELIELIENKHLEILDVLLQHLISLDGLTELSGSGDYYMGNFLYFQRLFDPILSPNNQRATKTDRLSVELELLTDMFTEFSAGDENNGENPHWISREFLDQGQNVDQRLALSSHRIRNQILA